MREDLAVDTPMPHQTVGTSVDVPSLRHVGTSAETSIAGMSMGVPITVVAFITAAGDMAQGLDSVSACIRRMVILRRCAVLRDSMTGLGSGTSIRGVRFRIECDLLLEEPMGEVARALEVNPNVLHRWRREFRQGQQRVSRLMGSNTLVGRPNHHNRTVERKSRLTAVPGDKPADRVFIAPP